MVRQAPGRGVPRHVRERDVHPGARHDRRPRARGRPVRRPALALDATFVERWSSAYVVDAVEHRLLTVVGPAVAARGHYRLDELAEVAAWKSARSKPRIAKNTSAEVRTVTKAAFDADEAEQHTILTTLSGVGIPTATTLLTVARPTQHTIFDVRATDALRRLGEWDGRGGYPSYLAVCRAASRRIGTDLRTLDRALWKWSQSR